MSHVAKIDFQVNDLEALADACNELGLVLNINQKTYRWYGTSVGDYPLPEGFTAADLGKSDHAISIPGNHSSYEIGVVKARDGSEGYELLWDFWAGGHGMQNMVGSEGVKLKDEYLAQTTIKHMRRRGRQVQRDRNAAGQIVIRGR